MENILSPQEKAKELFKKFYNPIFDIDLGINVSKDKKRYEAAIQCALIAVDEILAVVINSPYVDIIKYWQEVKQEIEKL
jgi:hypothetical protein